MRGVKGDFHPPGELGRGPLLEGWIADLECGAAAPLCNLTTAWADRRFESHPGAVCRLSFRGRAALIGAVTCHETRYL